MQGFTIKQQTTPAPGSDVLPPDAAFNKLGELQQRAMKLELQLSDLNVKTSQLREQRDRASDVNRQAALDKQWADAQHDMAAVSIELSAVHKSISQLETTLNNQTAFTIQPPPALGSPWLDSQQIMQIAGGAGMLLIPIILVLARNLWVRGSRKTEAIDIESSPRLQRIEQAVEAIAVEVERIGEAQRFSTKLLSERQQAVPIPAPRREAGSITPH